MMNRRSYAEEPRLFRAEVGGSFGPSFLVEWHVDELIYERMEGPDKTAWLNVQPTGARWRRFWDKCDKIGVWSWAPVYEPLSLVMDGSSWGLQIDCGRGTVLSEGSNAYPPDGDPDETEDFRVLCRAISSLVGAPPFY
jgi:hypothetical protein